MTDRELLPCPFCGAAPRFYGEHGMPICVLCSECGTSSGFARAGREIDAAAAWNTRATAAKDAEIEALRKDAARYRWLRERWGRITETYDGDSGRIVEIGTEPEGDGWDVEPETLDAAVDAAMAKGGA